MNYLLTLVVMFGMSVVRSDFQPFVQRNKIWSKASSSSRAEKLEVNCFKPRPHDQKRVCEGGPAKKRKRKKTWAFSKIVGIMRSNFVFPQFDPPS